MTALLLNSRPTASKTIFLDFDGYSIGSSLWENGGALTLNPFYGNFNATALTEIQQIWQRVSEDFAPFDVNVTTQDPGIEALRNTGNGDTTWGTRVVFASNFNVATGNSIINAGGGGTAYLNSFDSSVGQVALVFSRGEYLAAETASHELGHTLGLLHDGNIIGSEYYAGHGGTGPTGWGSIMGAPWDGVDEPMTQWSKGDYYQANNTQDDLAVITTGNGFGFRPDDHGNLVANATLTTGSYFTQYGVIEKANDVDMFRFETGAGAVTFNVLPSSRAYIFNGSGYDAEFYAGRGNNLDIAARLYRADGTVIKTFNPSATTDINFTETLSAGTYFLRIEGAATGTPLSSTPTGYTDYGSLGQYMIEGFLQPLALSPVTIEAESITGLSVYRVENISAASGGQALSLLGGASGETGTASFAFTGSAGTYDVIIGTFDENDGASTFSLSRSGSNLGSVITNQNLPSGAANATTKVERLIASSISIGIGDVFTISGLENSGEPARLDYLHFAPVNPI